MSNTNKPFQLRRSMRAIENKYIQSAEEAGFTDINVWLDALLQSIKSQIEKKDLQYQELKKQLEELEKENTKLKKQLDELEKYR